MSKVYDYVLEAILAKLEEGIIPWKQPWSTSPALNYVTRKSYRGINRLLLSGGEYLTMKQIQNLKGTVKKGAKTKMVVFYNVSEKENEKGEKEKIFVLRYYNVFSLEDVEGIPTKLEIKEHDIITEAEEVINGYRDKPEISNRGEKAYYHAGLDLISVPNLNKFDNPELYYSTLFHQMIHSTGHKDRQNRKTVDENDGLGLNKYTKEELIAEIGAAMLCATVGIENATVENNASYIQSWIRTLREDKRLIVHAAGAAQRAADYILKGSNFNHEEIEEEVVEV